MGRRRKIDFSAIKDPYLRISVIILFVIGAIGGVPFVFFAVMYAESHSISVPLAIIVPILAYIVFATLICYIIKGFVAIKKYLNYYPQLKCEVDLTNKKNILADTLIDTYIIKNGIEPFENHIKEIEQWKKNKIEKYKGNAKKIEKFNTRCLANCSKAFFFQSYRIQTRYYQVNYQKYPKKVRVNNAPVSVDESFIIERIDFLKKHDYNVTFNQYHAVDQRKVLTKALRDKIKKRDKYTCVLCGKEMHDGVGLQIDHIIPISRGGKSIAENLRVLCSNCNLGRGNKLDDD